MNASQERGQALSLTPTRAERLAARYVGRYVIYREFVAGVHGDWVARPVDAGSDAGLLRAPTVGELADRLQADETDPTD